MPPLAEGTIDTTMESLADALRRGIDQDDWATYFGANMSIILLRSGKDSLRNQGTIPLHTTIYVPPHFDQVREQLEHASIEATTIYALGFSGTGTNISPAPDSPDQLLSLVGI